MADLKAMEVQISRDFRFDIAHDRNIPVEEDVSCEMPLPQRLSRGDDKNNFDDEDNDTKHRESDNSIASDLSDWEIEDIAQRSIEDPTQDFGRFKGKLVTQGYSQKCVEDCDKVFAPVIRQALYEPYYLYSW